MQISISILNLQKIHQNRQILFFLVIKENAYKLYIKLKHSQNKQNRRHPNMSKCQDEVSLVPGGDVPNSNSQVISLFPKRIHQDEQQKQAQKKIIIGILILIVLAAVIYRILFHENKGNQHLVEQSSQDLFYYDKSLSNRTSKFQKIIWIFLDKTIAEFSMMQTFYYENIQRIADISNYTIKVLTLKNFKSYLSLKNIKKISDILSELNSRFKSNQKVYDLNFFQMLITSKLISLYALKQQGGVLIDRALILTQNLSWLDDAQKIPFFNKGVQNSDPQVITFFNEANGPKRQYVNNNFSSPYRNYMLSSTSVEPYFIAAKKGSAFISEWIVQFQKRIYDVEAGDYTRTNYSYLSEYFRSPLKVLQNRQRMLNQVAFLKNSTIRYAIDYYGYYSMNAKYFPLKISSTQYSYYPRIYHMLIKYSLAELEQTVGPLRYCVFIEQHSTNQLWKQYQEDEDKQSNHNESFFNRFIFRRSVQLNNTYPKDLVNLHNYTKWTQLPKNVWIYWGDGLDKAPAVTQLCVKNFQVQIKKNGFQLIKLSEENICNYLSNQSCSQMHKVWTNAKMRLFPANRADIARLLLLKQNGGIWIDANVILLEDLNWLVDIGSNPYIMNRFGAKPSVFLIYLHLNNDYVYKLAPDRNSGTTRAILSPGFQSSFIAAEPYSPLIIEWLDSYYTFLMKGKQFILQAYKQLHVENDHFIQVHEYLLLQQALQYVIQKKQKQMKQKTLEMRQNLQKTFDDPWAVDFYRVWTMNSFITPFKFLDMFNFDGNECKIMIGRYPRNYTEAIIGKAKYFIKMTSNIYNELDGVIRQSEEEINKKIDKESIFMQFLLKYRV